MTTDDFIIRAIEVHSNKYYYSQTNYINYNTKVIILCRIHGLFWQHPNNHLNGRGCPDCGRIKISESNKLFGISTRPDISKIVTPDGSKPIPIGNKGIYAIVDIDDYEKVNSYNWHLSCEYATNKIVGKMHRFIVDCPKDMVVDHINHNKLDNRKVNLRICTVRQNNLNTRPRKGLSDYKGVSFDKSKGKWSASISVNGKQIKIGHFNSEISAAIEYDKYAEKYFGNFAYLNFNI